MRWIWVVAFCGVASVAQADIAVRFVEGAPKDRFEIENTGGCGLGPLSVELDLSTSQAGLVFDVSAAGAGVEVFQPFELVRGAELVQDMPGVQDGDNRVVLTLMQMAPGGVLAFTIDVDDTMGGREITVNGSEIAGAQVSVVVDGTVSTGVVDETALAVAPLTACLS